MTRDELIQWLFDNVPDGNTEICVYHVEQECGFIDEPAKAIMVSGHTPYIVSNYDYMVLERSNEEWEAYVEQERIYKERKLAEDKAIYQRLKTQFEGKG